MKKILITGANSYIGTSFEKYIKENYPDGYIIDTVDMTDANWSKKSFKGYDSVFHVAGIVHQKETRKNAHLYYEVNTDLAFETAKKAKNEGVRQFIFLSSMSVYGMDTGIITKETKANPKSHYGKSKLKAEQLISLLNDDSFFVCILRPPMVYGEGCKGNYQKLVKIVMTFSVFPRLNNKRSAITISNLIRFVIMAINNVLCGIFFPQNAEYINISKLVENISQNNKHIYYSYLLGLCVLIFKPFSSTLKKSFGNLIYIDTEDFDFIYNGEN